MPDRVILDTCLNDNQRLLAVRKTEGCVTLTQDPGLISDALFYELCTYDDDFRQRFLKAVEEKKSYRSSLALSSASRKD